MFPLLLLCDLYNMAEKDPAFLFYSEKFILGVQVLSFEDRGKYITILAIMHQQGRMNEETIRLLVGSVSDNLKKKFKIDEIGFWYNERLEIEIEKRKNFTNSRYENGVKGGRPKKEKHKTTRLTTRLTVGKPTDNLVKDKDKDINTDKKDEPPITQMKIEFNIAFDGWIEMRKKIKKPATERAIELAKSELRKLAGKDIELAIKIINQSTVGCWTSFYELKTNSSFNNKIDLPTKVYKDLTNEL